MQLSEPKINLSHLKNLTNSVGLVQHANGVEPNCRLGCTMDDNARALLFTAGLFDLTHNETAMHLAQKYLSFISNYQLPSGQFHNLVSFAGRPLDSVGSEDCFGRAVLACAHAISGYLPVRLHVECGGILEKALKNVSHLESVRGNAFALLGLCAYYKKTRKAKIARLAEKASSKIVSSYLLYSDSSWKWFEDVITYSNGIIPASLLHASQLLGDSTLEEIAFEGLGFLFKKTLVDSVLAPIGQEGWCTKDGFHAMFDQQPIDGMASFYAAENAFRLDGSRKWLKRARKSYAWFLGENLTKKSLLNEANGGCFDGLGKEDINHNQGAESTLSLLLTQLWAKELDGEFFK